MTPRPHICRPLESARADSRDQHVQTPEAKRRNPLRNGGDKLESFGVTDYRMGRYKKVKI